MALKLKTGDRLSARLEQRYFYDVASESSLPDELKKHLDVTTTAELEVRIVEEQPEAYGAEMILKAFVLQGRFEGRPIGLRSDGKNRVKEPWPTGVSDPLLDQWVASVEKLKSKDNRGKIARKASAKPSGTLSESWPPLPESPVPMGATWSHGDSTYKLERIEDRGGVFVAVISSNTNLGTSNSETSRRREAIFALEAGIFTLIRDTWQVAADKSVVRCTTTLTVQKW